LVDSYRVDPIYQKCQEVLLEVLPGVGGQEAMLFSKELLNAYTSYAEYRNWDFQIVNYDINEIGIFKHL
jgi:peptide chain release factor 1